MANTLRIKRRASGGAGAPASLQNAELAFNEVDNVLYYGKGTGGAGGSATTVEAIGGSGAYVALAGDQTIAGTKTFSSTISGSINGNANTATTLATARNLSLTGDATATLSGFNGSANVSATLTLATSGVTASTYGTSTAVGQFTVDAKGRITAASAVNIAFPVTSVNGSTGSVTLTTSNVAEGTNLYYTDTRVRANRLDQMAVPTAAVSLNSQRITSLAEPSASTDAATKNYVDSVAQGLDVKTSVIAATTANITLTAPQTIDGISVIAGDRVLVKNQTTASANGIYVVAAGAWTRAVDADTWAELISAFVFVERGTINADTGYVCTVDPGGTLNSTNVTFAQFSGAGTYVAGNGLALTGNSFSVTGTSNRISVSGSGVDIASTYVGQTSITTLGTITSGTWNGTTIAVANGGTGATTLTGYVKGNGTSAMTASATIPNTDITGLGTMSTQAASNVAITGGSITNLTTFDGITIDGGTF
jgi:hypothetical protein